MSTNHHPVQNLTWKFLNDQEAYHSWDSWQSSSKESSPFQTFYWGKTKVYSGWKPFYLVSQDSNKQFVSAVLLLLKKKGPVGIVWTAGVVAGNGTLPKKKDLNVLMQGIGVWFYIFRMNFLEKKELEKSQKLQAFGFKKSWALINSGLTFILNVPELYDDFYQKLSSNWRHNLKRSQKYDLIFERWEEPNFEVIEATMKSMENFKQIDLQIPLEEFKVLHSHYQKNLFFYKATSKEGSIHSIRAVFRLNHKVFDFLAFTAPEGRKTYSSYGLVGFIIKDLISMQIKEYELSGIDPEKNPGVYNFKKGLGGEFTDYLGEWELTNFLPLAWLLNGYLRFKKK
jgi:lipid II:glycine glycyltransferase (peptidoglycan interpeptide bridge formation enzyme)